MRLMSEIALCRSFMFVTRSSSPLVSSSGSAYTVGCHRRSISALTNRNGTGRQRMLRLVTDRQRTDALLTSNDWPLWSAIAGCAALGQAATHTNLGRLLSEPLLVMLCGFMGSTLDILPLNCHAYDIVWEWFVPLAAVLYLLESDYNSLMTTSNWVMPLFCIGMAGTVLGTIVAWAAVGRCLGTEGWKIASALCATCIGGSANLASTATALNLTTGPLLAATVAADNVAIMVYLASISMIRVDKSERRKQLLPERIGNITTAVIDLVGLDPDGMKKNQEGRQDVPLCGLFLGLLCCALGKSTATVIELETFGMAFMTLIASALGLIMNRRSPSPLLKGCRAAGSGLMAIFFVVIGACCGSITVHLLFMLLCGQRLGVPLTHILTASNANIGGPGTAAGMAAARGWKQMVQPAVLIGCLGYSVANFVGVVMSYLLRSTV